MAEHLYRLDEWDDELLPPELESQSLEDWAAFLAAGPRWCEDEEREEPPAAGAHLTASLWTIHRTLCHWKDGTVQAVNGDPIACGQGATYALPYHHGMGWSEDEMLGSLEELGVEMTGDGEFEIASWDDSMTVPCTLVFRPGPPPTLTPLEADRNG